MSGSQKKTNALSYSVENHSLEGVNILHSEPSAMIKWTLYTLGLLLIAIVIWSFYGRADVIVTSKGTYTPESEVRRVYTPIDGELIDIYVTEGMSVQKGDILARINAKGAINAVSEAMKAKLQLAEAERNFRLFPNRKRLLELKKEATKKKLEIEEKKHHIRVSEDLTKLANQQKIKLEKAQAKLEETFRQKKFAKQEAEKYQRLYQLPGGGGVSKQKVDEKVNAFLSEKAKYRLAESELGELELKLTSEYAKKKVSIEDSNQILMDLRVEYERTVDTADSAEKQVMFALQAARLTSQSMEQISFDNIDEDNFLRVIASIDGVITSVAYTQPGDKIDPKRPFLGIAPVDAKNILEIEIQEKDRGFLREGQDAKLKFSAFPFQQYGFVKGTLAYISPSTSLSTLDKKSLVYRGRVNLEKKYFVEQGVKHWLRIGMTADVEIVVKKRRLIDLALDPFRKLKNV